MKHHFPRVALAAIVTAAALFSPGRLLAQTPEAQEPAPDFFIEAQVDNTAPVVGQQVTYSLRRYRAVDFPNPPHYREHPFNGFWDAPLLQRPTYTATVGGREYRVHPTHIALFPNRAGPITIEPAHLIIPGDGPEADTVLESQAISLQVQPLPNNAPANFTGAVGQFEINAQLTPTEAQVNQSLTLAVEIKGTGNIEPLNRPALPALPRWRIFEGEVTTNVSLAKERVKGSRRFEWSVVPGRPGQQEFPSISFSYFDPQAGTYQTIHTQPIPLTITPAGNASALPPAGSKQEVRRLSSDIRHIKPAPDALPAGANTSIWRDPLLFWVCSIVPLLAIGAAWGWQQWQQHYLANTPSARRRRARARAKKILAHHRAPADPYATVKSALLGYLADKLQQPVAGLTASQLVALLNQAQVDPQLVERVRTMLNRVDASRFAPITDEQTTTRSLLASTRVLIDDLEKFFGDKKPVIGR